MTQSETPHPNVTTRDEWLDARKTLLQHEKELTKLHDRVAAERRRLPMVRIEKDYVFDSPQGKRRLLDLFEGRRQLIVYHFMFDPEWDEGCTGCTGLVDALGDLSLLAERNTSFTLVSRAPLPKLEAYKAKKGWTQAWVSSHGSDFNYDFHATLDEAVKPREYNYKPAPEVEGEEHGYSVFFRLGDEVYHTYSVYARGTESLTDAYNLLDMTPYG